MKESGKKQPRQLKPIGTAKAVAIYVLCAALIVGMLVGNYFTDAYRELITVYLSGSGTVTTAESEALCLEIEEEGMVLLQNRDGALPLKSGAAVSVFGQDSVDFVYGGAGSGSVDTSKAATLKQALEKSGFQVNQALWDFYLTGPGKDYRKSVPDETGRGDFAVNEVPVSAYTQSVKDSFAQYHDAAIVCIGRSGGESSDIPTQPLASGYRYLELDQDELDLLAMACGSFDTVVLVLNSNNTLELGFLEDPAYANVKACLWCGGVGQEGIYAIGKALAGTVNPSGRLVDTYAYDSLSAPSATNLGDYSITNSTITNGGKYLVYAEGIYVGYRYYETRYEDGVLGQGNAGDYDYGSAVQFPFGHGLSYTQFQWSDYQVKEASDGFEASVTVTNTGDRAGKDVVQIYMQSPYTDYDRANGVEKSAVELVGFAKTGLLEPGKSETVTISVPKEVMKTYDASGAGTYILDAGDYYFAAGHDAHHGLNNILAAKGFTAADGMDADGDAAMAWKTTVDVQDSTTYAVSLATGKAVSNQFQDTDIRYYDGGFRYLSRSDWAGTWPETYQGGSWQAPGTLLKDLEWKRGVDVVGTGSEPMPTFEAKTERRASDLVGTDYSDPAWQELAEQLTPDQAMRLVRLGGYATVHSGQGRPLRHLRHPGGRPERHGLPGGGGDGQHLEYRADPPPGPERGRGLHRHGGGGLVRPRREHPPLPLQRAELRILLRGWLPLRADQRRRGAGRPREGRHHLHEALRPQRPGDKPLRRGCLCQRAGHPGGIPERLRVHRHPGQYQRGHGLHEPVGSHLVRRPQGADDPRAAG